MPSNTTRRTIAVLAAGALSTLAFAGTAMAHKKTAWHPHPGAAYADWAADHGLKGAGAKWNKDVDHDGLTNVAEFKLHTHPRHHDDLDDIDEGEIEVKGIVQSFTAPTESSDGELKITVAGSLSTLALPKGATVIGQDVLTKGSLVEVEIEIEHGTTVVKAHTEDETGDDDGTTTGGTTTGGTTTSGRGRGGGDD